MNAAALLARSHAAADHLNVRTNFSKIALFACDLDDGGASGLAADRVLIAPIERHRADKFLFDRDRTRYIRGRAFLRRKLADATDQPAAALQLVEGLWGKPLLCDGAVDFNLSHSGATAILAISAAGPVGIDLERIDRSVDISGLSQTCLLPTERGVLESLETDARRRRFFAFWTAKEAVMKLIGRGMSLPPIEIALQLDRGWPVGCRQIASSDRSVSSAVELIYLDLKQSDIICCLARARPG